MNKSIKKILDEFYCGCYSFGNAMHSSLLMMFILLLLRSMGITFGLAVEILILITMIVGQYVFHYKKFKKVGELKNA